MTEPLKQKDWSVGFVVLMILFMIVGLIYGLVLNNQLEEKFDSYCQELGFQRSIVLVEVSRIACYDSRVQGDKGKVPDIVIIPKEMERSLVKEQENE
jgi:hypothetical protein